MWGKGPLTRKALRRRRRKLTKSAKRPLSKELKKIEFLIPKFVPDEKFEDTRTRVGQKEDAYEKHKRCNRSS